MRENKRRENKIKGINVLDPPYKEKIIIQHPNLTLPYLTGREGSNIFRLWDGLSIFQNNQNNIRKQASKLGS